MERAPETSRSPEPLPAASLSERARVASRLQLSAQLPAVRASVCPSRSPSSPTGGWGAREAGALVSGGRRQHL